MGHNLGFGKGTPMNIGFVGLGKLGLPVSIAMALRGHKLFGYEIDPQKREQYRKGKANLYEPKIDEQLQEALDKGYTVCDTLEEMIDADPEIIFIAVPTPSKKNHSFDTSYVIKAVKDIGKVIKSMKNKTFWTTIVIISTILPQTMRKEVKPALERTSGRKVGEDIGLCYNASFIAMGTTIEDFYHPEFILIGEKNPLKSREGDVLEKFYRELLWIAHYPGALPIFRLSWENAELVKMIYNTFIGLKIVFGNNLMEMCQKIPHTNCDTIINVLGEATDRIISTSYLYGGMGDGGECHPRDNWALWWLSEKLNLSTNIFEFVMDSRYKQAEWLADELASYKLPIVILGARYKPNTNLTTASASLLVKEILERDYPELKVTIFDPFFGMNAFPDDEKLVYLVAHKFKFIEYLHFLKGSIVVDPWGWLKKEYPEKIADVEYISVGRRETFI